MITKENYFQNTNAAFTLVTDEAEKASILEKSADYTTIFIRRHSLNENYLDNGCWILCSDGETVLEFDEETESIVEATWHVVHSYINSDEETVYRIEREIEGSKFWYTAEGVYRLSDWWGKCRDCFWSLDNTPNAGEIVLGFCKFEDFSLNKTVESVDIK